tara:strand:+ start:315 stop:1337 length:1023 start_codon:yes stop_codon:yes gene_type:complete
MARQFLIGELGSTTYSSGKLADTGLNIEVLDVSNDEGPISYNASTMANPDMFRIVQGTTSGPNVYSNWMNPKNVIAFDGSSAETSTHHEARLVVAGNSVVAAGANNDLELKFVLHNGVTEEFWHLNVTSIPAGATTADSAADDFIKTDYDAATKPDWLNATCSVNGTLATTATGAASAAACTSTHVQFLGQVPGGTTTSSGDAWEGDAARISVIVVSQNDIGTATFTASESTRGENGVGTYYSVKKFEDKMKGIMYGYYNRRNLPNTPDNGAVVGSTYDMITLVATKDGSSASGQIHGVDNLDEIFIAGKAGVSTIYTADDLTSFVEKLNTLLPLTGITV